MTENMPTRLLHESICTSESLSKCSPKAQDAFPRLLLAADNFGTFQINGFVLKGRLWPLRDDVSPEDILGWIREFEEKGMVKTWQTDGKIYGIFVRWGDFQRVDPRLNRKYPEPPKELLGITQNSPELPGNTRSQEQLHLQEQLHTQDIGALRTVALRVLEFLNEKSGKNLPAKTPKGEWTANIGFIVARLKEGFTEQQCRSVIVRRCRECLGDPKKEGWLGPDTIFNKTKFPKYIGDLVAK